MPRRRPIHLSRVDVRQRHDKPTNSFILQYVGRALTFDDYLYGYPDGTFFAVDLSEVPYPEALVDLAVRESINIEALPETPRLQMAVAEALIAEAMVDAPALLAELTSPPCLWHEWDRRELERRHQIAMAKVTEVTRFLRTDIELRAAGLKLPDLRTPQIAPLLDLPPAPILPLPPAPPALLPPPGAAPVYAAPAPCPPCGETDVPDEQHDSEDEGSYLMGSQILASAQHGIKLAREHDLPQRLPKGMRRRLRQMPPGQYIVHGEAVDARLDLCAAMTDGRNMGRKGREAVVIDWDGEWPVVVRRYGHDGRTIYKVETALRRHGVSTEAA